MKNDNPNSDDISPKIRDHEYDGIQEYDQRLPNWWLYTLYGAIFFAFVYWFLLFQPGGTLKTSVQRIRAELAFIEAAKLKRSAESLTDDELWNMSRNDIIVAEGKKTYHSICVTCHGKNLEGGIGFNLADDNWVHGNHAKDLVRTVTYGIEGKGMQAWGPVLGGKKVAEVVAFVLSHHDRAKMESSELVLPPQ